MTPFETHGFLSDELLSWREFEHKYQPKLALSIEIVQLAQKIIFDLNVVTSELRDLLLSTLLVRVSSTFQAFLLLSQRGLIHQAEMLVRAIAESMFIVGAVRKQPDFAEKWLVADEVGRKRSLQRLNDDRRRRGEAPDEEAVRLIAELDLRIRDESIQKFSTERIAQLAGLQSYYDSLYSYFSMAVHSSTRSLDKALKTDAGGKVIAVEYGPQLEGFDIHFDYSISMMLWVLHEVSQHFEIETAGIEALQSANRALAGETSEIGDSEPKFGEAGTTI